MENELSARGGRVDGFGEALEAHATPLKVGDDLDESFQLIQRSGAIADLRTGVETSNTGAVLDGDLDTFMQAELERLATGAPLVGAAEPE